VRCESARERGRPGRTGLHSAAGLLLLAIVAIVSVAAAAGCGGPGGDSKLLPKSPPRINSVEPGTTVPGGEVEILGTGFGDRNAYPEGDRQKFHVSVAGQNTQLLSWSEYKIMVMVPTSVGAGAQTLLVVTPGGQDGMRLDVFVQTVYSTPNAAMLDVMRKSGMDPSGYVFVLKKTSRVDSNWRLYEAKKKGVTAAPVFMLHLENGGWVVKDPSTTMAQWPADMK